jgi:hypothetical protein
MRVLMQFGGCFVLGLVISILLLAAGFFHLWYRRAGGAQ